MSPTVATVPARIVLVGSDRTFLDALRDRLGSKGYEAGISQGEVETLRLTRGSPVGVVVVSLRDLLGDGLRMLRRVKKSAPDWEVITLSTPDNTRLSIDSMKAGAFQDLALPLDLDHFLDKLKCALDRSIEQAGKSNLRKRLERLATAVAFAEAGDLNMSREIYTESDDDEPISR